MIRVVIFDFDDTLIDNRVSDYQGFLIPCIRLGLSLPTVREIYRFRKKGLLAKDIAKHILNHSKKYFLLDRFLSIRRNFINSMNSNRYFRLKKRTKLLLKFLKRKEIKCFICSVRKNRKLVHEFLKNEKILKYFDGIHLMVDLSFNIENNTPSKKALIKSRLIQKVMKDYSFKPVEVIFVGNSEEDIKSASKTRVKFIFYKNSYLPNLPKLDLQNIIKVSNMDRLRKKIDKMIMSDAKIIKES